VGKGKWDLSPVVLEEKKEKEENNDFGWNLDACMDATSDSSQ
jgi:hypothetical protein